MVLGNGLPEYQLKDGKWKIEEKHVFICANIRFVRDI